jgi:hypothetical protein
MVTNPLVTFFPGLPQKSLGKTVTFRGGERRGRAVHRGPAPDLGLKAPGQEAGRPLSLVGGEQPEGWSGEWRQLGGPPWRT